MTLPRAVQNTSHSQPPSRVNGDRGTGVSARSEQYYTLPDVSAKVSHATYPLTARVSVVLMMARTCQLPRTDQTSLASCVSGVASWNHPNGTRGGCLVEGACQKGSNMSPKKYGLWTGEFPSTISPSSPAAKRRCSSWSIAPNATPAQRSAGSRAPARRPALRFARSSLTSWSGSNDRSAA